MHGPIIVVTLSHYFISYALGWGLSSAQLSMPLLLMLLPPLLAGYFGAVQFVRTERKTLRLRDRLRLAFNCCLTIVLAPFAASTILMIATSLTGGLVMLQILANAAAIFTVTAIVATLIFTVYGLPAIFIGISLGLWTQRPLIRR